MAPKKHGYTIGVDVGTGSVRAALMTLQGDFIKGAVKEIGTWRPRGFPDFYQQSSTDVWQAVCNAVRDITYTIDVKMVKGIGFDGTCSLVVLDKKSNPLSVSPNGEPDQNIILWMDHRAVGEAELINKLHHAVLQTLGGKMSPEMATPKLMWLKRQMFVKCWTQAGHFFELPDFLTWRATGAFSRSSCTMTCAWTYQIDANEKKGWNIDFFRQLGLEDLAENNWEKIGSEILAPGEPCGKGLTKQAASEMGLLEGIPVATSTIDGNAGAIGMICVKEKIDAASLSLDSVLCLVSGTSNCHLFSTDRAVYVHGLWGPFYNAVVPGMYVNEGGQSASGSLLDFIIETHEAYPEIRAKLTSVTNLLFSNIYDYLNNLVDKIAQKRQIPVDELTHNIHVWPDFHGNRSPEADPSLRGMVCGLNMSSSEEDLAILYLATLQSLAYGTRHIVETLQAAGHKNLRQIIICGGMRKNNLFVQTHANVLSMPVLRPRREDSVLLGSGMLGARAAGVYDNLRDAMESMAGTAFITEPYIKSNYHDRKYKVFLKMLQHQKEYRQIMEGAA
ncbi:unnamed protein product [Bemisia tabaci]|uniref:FGGY carbohydrate kinase domain-containing protein n=2 Tax=Bemisia tabaci TaxID=7038 RepID=A0A9P0AKT5_BEMTA|nr:unnamed protein product [Bemisia tabaci]